MHCLFFLLEICYSDYMYGSVCMCIVAAVVYFGQTSRHCSKPTNTQILSKVSLFIIIYHQSHRIGAVQYYEWALNEQILCSIEI